MPSNNEFYVSAVYIDNDLKIFNLQYDFDDFNDDLNNFLEDKNNYNDQNIRCLNNCIHLFVLYIVTTIRIKIEYDRKFKSEYIFSQLLMLACKY